MLSILVYIFLYILGTNTITKYAREISNNVRSNSWKKYPFLLVKLVLDNLKDKVCIKVYISIFYEHNFSDKKIQIITCVKNSLFKGVYLTVS